jgi:hypothetical protein
VHWYSLFVIPAKAGIYFQHGRRPLPVRQTGGAAKPPTAVNETPLDE